MFLNLQIMSGLLLSQGVAQLGFDCVMMEKRRQQCACEAGSKFVWLLWGLGQTTHEPDTCVIY